MHKLAGHYKMPVRDMLESCTAPEILDGLAFLELEQRRSFENPSATDCYLMQLTFMLYEFIRIYIKSQSKDGRCDAKELKWIDFQIKLADDKEWTNAYRQAGSIVKEIAVDEKEVAAKKLAEEIARSKAAWLGCLGFAKTADGNWVNPNREANEKRKEARKLRAEAAARRKESRIKKKEMDALRQLENVEEVIIYSEESGLNVDPKAREHVNSEDLFKYTDDERHRK